MTSVDVSGAPLTVRSTAGADAHLTITFTDVDGEPIDVSARTFDGDIRATYPTDVVAAVTVATDDAGLGVIVASLPGTVNVGRYVFDVWDTSTGQRRPLVSGRWHVGPTVWVP